MVISGILVGLRLAEIRTMVGPNSSDMPSNQTKKVLLGIYHFQIQPEIRPYQVSDVTWQDVRTEDKASDWLIWNSGMLIDHFTVVGKVTWPLTSSEAGVDLVLIQTSLLLLCKSSCSHAN